MRENFTHYGDAYGEEELRQAVCHSLKRDFGSRIVLNGCIDTHHVDFHPPGF
jgi:aspartate/methionine/tyrosine aminotransferase